MILTRLRDCQSWNNLAMCRAFGDIPQDKKVGTYKEYVVSYRIWGWRDVVIDRVSISENIKDSADIDKKVAENRTESPKSCDYNHKTYNPAWDVDDNFYWKLVSEQRHVKSGSCSSSIRSTIGEDRETTIVRGNERVATRRNVFMILLENTIVLDYHRITSKFPKYTEMKRQILEYEESQGLDLTKVARVLILNLMIL